MKERPITFSTEMVRAILEGRKTMTRRGVAALALMPDDLGGMVAKCPYGVPGDRLWCKEDWAPCRLERDHSDEYRTFSVPLGQHDHLVYRADIDATDDVRTVGWKSSRFMPRWASRILLEIVSVRVERVQDISPSDALAEGVIPDNDNFSVGGDWHNGVAVFQELWDHIYRKEPEKRWNANPWVWVIEFKVVS